MTVLGFLAAFYYLAYSKVIPEEVGGGALLTRFHSGLGSYSPLLEGSFLSIYGAGSWSTKYLFIFMTFSISIIILSAFTYSSGISSSSINCWIYCLLNFGGSLWREVGSIPLINFSVDSANFTSLILPGYSRTFFISYSLYLISCVLPLAYARPISGRASLNYGGHSEDRFGETFLNITASFCFDKFNLKSLQNDISSPWSILYCSACSSNPIPFLICYLA